MKEHLTDMKCELASGEARILDVRELNEWMVGHLTDAELVPLSELESKTFDASKLQKDGKKTYLYCRSGRRVHAAKPLLNALGVKSVIPLSEGFLELKQYGFLTKEGL